MKAVLRDEGGFQSAKQEEDKNNNETGRNVMSRLVPSSTSTSRQWAGFRNPRIVRVSRSFGGKDRHSKVCTIRGLRDRRIRLSVPTAIQLYDLQDKLGLSQPSKVIDWLLDASKEDIDKLPPLQMPTGFGQFHQQFLLPHESLSSTNNSSSSTMISSFFPTTSSVFLRHGIRINESNVDHGANNSESSSVSAWARSTKYWDMDAYGSRTKNKGVGREDDDDYHHQPICEKGKWIETNDDQVQDRAQQASAQKFFPLMSYSSLSGLTNNSLPYSSYINQWEPSNLSLSQFGNHGHQVQSENPLNSTPIASSSTIPSAGSSHLYLCPSATMTPIFPSYPSYLASSVETDPRQLNHHHHLQFLSSSSQQHVLPTSLMPSLQLIGSPIKFPFQTNVNAKLLDQQDNDESEDEDGNDS